MSIDTHVTNPELRLAKLQYAQLKDKEMHVVAAQMKEKRANPSLSEEEMQSRVNAAVGQAYPPVFEKIRQAGGIVRDQVVCVDFRDVTFQTRLLLIQNLKDCFGSHVDPNYVEFGDEPYLAIETDARHLAEVKSYCDQALGRHYQVGAIDPWEVKVDGLEDYDAAEAYRNAIQAEKQSVEHTSPAPGLH